MTVTSFEKAILFLGSALEQDSVPPTVVALSDGGVQLAWYRNGIDVEATFPEATEADLYIRDRAADAEFEFDPSQREALEVFQRYVDRLRV